MGAAFAETVMSCDDARSDSDGFESAVSAEETSGALAPSAASPSTAVAKASPELIIAHQAFDERSETIRSLRTEILMRIDSENGVFAVVSAAPAEGRSRIAAELAVSFAQMGGDTLLIDADMRRPRQHELFCSGNVEGLSDTLESLESPVIQGVTDLPRLSLISAGSRCSNPLELLSAPRFAHLLEGWRGRYRHVVIDTPPVNDCADALAVANAARQVLTVFRTEHGSTRNAKQMMLRLQATQARVLGAVLGRF